MQRTFGTRALRIGLVIVATAMSACGLEKQTQPSLIGPADGGQSIQMTAVPDQLPRDGSSQSVVTVIARDPSNRPIVGQRLILSLASSSPAGATLSSTEVTTNSQGTATFSVSAPTSGSMGNAILVIASPVGTDANNTNTRTMSIAINPSNATAPNALFTWNPPSPDMGQTVTFDASTTTDEGARCTSCSFIWDFGDSTTGTGQVVTHVFGAAGTYVVTLIATDSVGTSSTPLRQSVTVAGTTIPTNLSVASVPNPPIAKQAATFTATATAAANHHIVRYQFSWGDGDTNTTSSAVIQHTYSQSGSYLITLTVRDDLNQSSTGYTTITVSAGLTAAFTTNKAGTTVTFDASTSSSQVASTITDYAWDFETDGTYDTNGASPITAHDYGSNGTYRATLRITDSRGVTATLTQTITIP
jgi:large repetitive protein